MKDQKTLQNQWAIGDMNRVETETSDGKKICCLMIASSRVELYGTDEIRIRLVELTRKAVAEIIVRHPEIASKKGSFAIAKLEGFEGMSRQDQNKALKTSRGALKAMVQDVIDATWND